MTRTILPIDSLLPLIVERLRSQPNLVVQASPGAGKTTRVPAALLAAGFGEVLVLEPRRLAARMAARRVALERGEPLGKAVGYHVRFEEAAGPETRLRFLTEGVLTRRLLSDPQLNRAGAVVLDEFHERHLEGDLALALLRRLQKTSRPDLRLVVMSATLDTEPIAAYLGGCGVVRSDVRQHPLEIAYTPHAAQPLDEEVAAALERVVSTHARGHVLVFLPGAAEIRRALRACEPTARRKGLLPLPLHGDLPPEEQDRAVGPSAQPKLILSTNIAESSITIDGVTAVIDSGLARVAGHSPWSGLPSLNVARVSQASADQRAGRAGRTGPGTVVRLYPLEDYLRSPAHDLPEIFRADLAPLTLHLHAMGIAGVRALEWLETPPADAGEEADRLLTDLGALDHNGGLTKTGRAMARLPLHPRLARMLVEATALGVADEACAVAALLSAGERLPEEPAHAGRSDLLYLLESAWSGRTRRIVQQIRRALTDTGRAVPVRRIEAKTAGARAHYDDPLLIAALVAFPDQVARRRSGDDLLLSSGGSARLASSSTVRDAEFLVAIEVEDRSDRQLPLVRIASGIEVEWLLDLFPGRLNETVETRWNHQAERVEAVARLSYDKLVLHESRQTPDAAEAGRLLARKALEAGLQRFTEVEQLDRYLARAQFAAEHLGFDPPGDEQIRTALEQVASGLTSFAELKQASAGLLRALEAQLPLAASSRIEHLAPSRIRLPGGRNVPVHYERGKPPWISSRLQDFFGMREAPKVGGGKVPVVVHLLAPNQRPVQMTADLSGFWERLYPQVRRELMRRYPKHAWPEDPLAR